MLTTTLALAATALTAAAVQIHPLGRDDMCVDVQGANFNEGTPVQIYECNGTPAQNWEFQQTTNGGWSWRVVGTDMCMKFAGVGANGIPMALLSCDASGSLSGWALNATEHTIINNSRYGSYALDLTDGDMSNGNQLQIWQYEQCNANQLWSWA